MNSLNSSYASALSSRLGARPPPQKKETRNGAGTVSEPQAISGLKPLSGAYRGWLLYEWPNAILFRSMVVSTCLDLDEPATSEAGGIARTQSIDHSYYTSPFSVEAPIEASNGLEHKINCVLDPYASTFGVSPNAIAAEPPTIIDRAARQDEKTMTDLGNAEPELRHWKETLERDNHHRSLSNLEKTW
ncbi:hypothetical protein E6O75_ATG10402 [Venturia nashicola]|uniref:Uncharacterized protein n=1 Tax=Venturia nashicola TaxID=86259 RepID=A0A4Z1PA16_9PEZI|nr:hypothetical protein E6O75_ATG10402 [Venturia nashicola]